MFEKSECVFLPREQNAEQNQNTNTGSLESMVNLNFLERSLEIKIKFTKNLIAH